MAVKKIFQRDDVLELALGLVGQYGEQLTILAFQRETGIAQRVIYDLFGSWRALRVEVGLKADALRNSKGVTREEILERMRAEVAEHGEGLTFRQFQMASGYSARLIERRFGNWGELRVAVGFSPRAPIRKLYSDEEIILDLYRVYRLVRERPVYDKHRLRGGRISPGTICHRLGSWDWACRRLRDLLVGHGHFNREMELPKELEEKIRAERQGG